MRIAAWDNAEIRSSFLRYATIGAGNTALNFATYATLTRGFAFWRAHYLLANLATFVVVVTWSFYWNKRWSFRNHERRHASQYTKFFLVTVGGIVIEQSALAFGTGVLGILDLFVKLFVAPVIVAWNFTMYRVWAFRSRTMTMTMDHDKMMAINAPRG